MTCESSNYTAMRVGAEETISVDYTDTLLNYPGATIASATWEMRKISGDETDLPGMFVTPAAIDGLFVSVRVKPRFVGHYRPICWARLSTGDLIDLPDAGRGTLEVVQ